MASKRSPTQVDSEVGQRIRYLRIGLGMPLSELGGRIGVSNPQVHRYECGLTRVAASRLVAIAAALRVSVETLLINGTTTDKTAETHKTGSQEATLLLRAFNGIDRRDQRNALLALARSMASGELSSEVAHPSEV